MFSFLDSSILYPITRPSNVALAIFLFAFYVKGAVTEYMKKASLSSFYPGRFLKSAKFAATMRWDLASGSNPRLVKSVATKQRNVGFESLWLLRLRGGI